jgi:hypothetical protein
MSKIAISGASTGTATFTIESPATSTNRTITLADATGTMVVSGTTPSLNGITFPATQVASADVNTLDDYEEGTFTPTISSGITSPTYANQFGFYTKVGRFVSFQLRVQTNGGTAAASIIIVSGLPFTTASTVGLYGGAYFNYTTSGLVNSLSNNIPTMHIPSGGVRIELYQTDGTNFDGTDANNVANINLYISGSYFSA